MKISESSYQSINNLLSSSLIKSRSDEFIKFFTFLSRFNHYSKYNSMLVYIQNKDVAYYGSAGFWKRRFHRTIQQNARPYIILTPFSPVTIVYDIMETDGNETAEELMKTGLPYQPFTVKGTFSEELYDRLLKRMKDWGIPLLKKPLSYFSAGYVWAKDNGRLEICINANKSIDENFVVIIHELAHLFLGHTGYEYLTNTSKKEDVKMKLRNRRGLGRSIEELEAETIAYLISRKIGLTTQSAEYLAGYIHNENDIGRFNYETVIHTVDKIERLFLK